MIPAKLGFSQEKINKTIHLQRVEYLVSRYEPLLNPHIKIIILPVLLGFTVVFTLCVIIAFIV